MKNFIANILAIILWKMNVSVAINMRFDYGKVSPKTSDTFLYGNHFNSVKTDDANGKTLHLPRGKFKIKNGR